LSIDALIEAIASVSDGWRIAAFAIAAILVAARIMTGSNSKAVNKGGKKSDLRFVLVVVAILICVLGLAPIIANAYLKQSGHPAVYRLRIMVVNPQGIPVSGAILRTPVLHDTAVTSDGVAELTIPRATLAADDKITVYADLDVGGLHAVEDFQLSDDPNPSKTIKLKLVSDAVVSGLVEDSFLHAVSGASVSVVGGEAGLTKSNGTFSLKANAAVGQQVRLHVEKSGYQAVDQDHPAGEGPATIELDRIGSRKRH
jgi:hypothetical protein